MKPIGRSGLLNSLGAASLDEFDDDTTKPASDDTTQHADTNHPVANGCKPGGLQEAGPDEEPDSGAFASIHVPSSCVCIVITCAMVFIDWQYFVVFPVSHAPSTLVASDRSCQCAMRLVGFP